MGVFRADELARIKAELGYNVLNVGADAYVGITTMFEAVINEHIDALVETTSPTSVSTAGQATIVLAAATGFADGQRVVVDVDARREAVTVQSLTGTSLTALFNKEHSGTYPVTVEGPVTIAREALAEIVSIKAEMRESLGLGAIKKADEVEFFPATDIPLAGGDSLFGVLGRQLTYWRDELASALGVPNLWVQKKTANLRLSVY